MVYNRHFFSMKKALFALIIAFPMIFSGCSKDDNRTSSGVPPQYIDFAKINSWIGTSEADVANELLQLGFEKKDDYYEYFSMEPYLFVSFSPYSIDGIIQSAGTQYCINVDSYSTTLEAFKNCVNQERQLFKNNNPEYFSGTIRWINLDEGSDRYSGQENYNSYESLISAATEMSGKRYVELQWEDRYIDRDALTISSYMEGGLQEIRMVLSSR